MSVDVAVLHSHVHIAMAFPLCATFNTSIIICVINKIVLICCSVLSWRVLRHDSDAFKVALDIVALSRRFVLARRRAGIFKTHQTRALQSELCNNKMETIADGACLWMPSRSSFRVGQTYGRTPCTTSSERLGLANSIPVTDTLLFRT